MFYTDLTCAAVNVRVNVFSQLKTDLFCTSSIVDLHYFILTIKVFICQCYSGTIQRTTQVAPMCQ